jgi:hypothetical protein
MTLAVAAAKLGPCEIVAPLGAGGMREVYRARTASWNERSNVLVELCSEGRERMAREAY